MLQQKPELFRRKSLERLSSPEQLDQLMQVIKPNSWIPLASLGFLVTAALAWSIFGRIPITVEGQGVLIYPRSVVPLQSKSSGQILSLSIKVGDVIRKGQVIATIDQSELQKQLEQQRQKSTELQSQDQASGSIQEKSARQEKQAIQQQRQSLQQSLQNAYSLRSVYQQRLAVLKPLYAERVIVNNELLNMEQQYLKQQETITSIEAQLKELDSRGVNQTKQDLEASTTRKREIQDAKREIAKLELQLSNNGQIISQQNGHILEITVAPGQVINAGTRIANIGEEKPSAELTGITYFSVEDGKKIQPGMTLHITPKTVKRERFGGIEGIVTTVSPFPITREGAAAEVGNPEVVAGLAPSNGSLVQVSSQLISDSGTLSGYKWSSSKGPQMQISSGTTTAVRVKVEERAPITFIMPILRSTTGIY